MDEKFVYLLWHIHHLRDSANDEKMLGEYESEDEAQRKILTLYKSLPGFNQSDDNFQVSRREIGKDNWLEGFTKAQSM